MPSEMDAELRNSLRSLQSTIEGVGRAQKKTTEEVARFADAAKKAFGGTRKDVDDVDKKAKEHVKTWRDVGQAIGRVGGPIGDLVSRFTGLQSSEKGLARLALGAAAVGVAMRLVVTGLERAGLQARESAAAWRQMTDAMLAAHQKSLAIGTAGAGQADEQRKLIAAGPEAAQHAKMLADSNTGIGESDANQGVAAIYSKYGNGKRARDTVEAARALHQTGAMSFAEAANSMIDYGADASQPGVARKAAARVYVEKTGRRGVDPNDAFSEALARTGGDPFLKAAAGVTTTNNQTRAAQRGAVLDGRAQAAAGQELAQTRDPVAAAVLAVANANALTVQELQKIADGSNKMLEWIKHYTTGSNQDAVDRAKVAGASGAAVYNPGG